MLVTLIPAKSRGEIMIVVMKTYLVKMLMMTDQRKKRRKVKKKQRIAAHQLLRTSASIFICFVISLIT